LREQHTSLGPDALLGWPNFTLQQVSDPPPAQPLKKSRLSWQSESPRLCQHLDARASSAKGILHAARIFDRSELPHFAPNSTWKSPVATVESRNQNASNSMRVLLEGVLPRRPQAACAGAQRYHPGAHARESILIQPPQIPTST
jgi:hypothetical protein